MSLLKRAPEELARRTSRRGFFGRGADLAFGALIGAAAGGVSRTVRARADHVPTHTTCAFPGPPCACEHCVRPDGVTSNGVCAKPCVILTAFYASGCWVDFRDDDGTAVTCCDCDCQGLGGIGWCGCGSDHHNHPDNCPQAAG
ncbi:MAG: hypothetical protein U1B78_04990 [Dehalococcoidia bacterium]|nr:hypothetical protein [Dehalococcoidia bacterium]